MTVLIVGIATLLVVVYIKTPIPDEEQADAVRQSSLINYSNGEPLARVGMNRTSVSLEEVPEHVQNAVLAAEDRKFWTEPGVSPTGIARAFFTAATGGDVTGASTITQQLARNYWVGLSQERSATRKLKEIMISIRMGNEMDKKKILQTYLNTVYFGRQAYGIQAAARAYFHTTVDKLDASQAAMLAGMIQQPTYFVTYGNPTDPAQKKAKEALVDRWGYVLDGMVEEGWLDEGKRQALEFPQTQKDWSPVEGGPQVGYLRDRVIAELESYGITEQMLETGGYKIKTTFNSDLQQYTAKAVEKIKKEKGLNDQIHFGLTAVDPKTGGVVAAYGGPAYKEQQFDDSFQGRVQPGSSFKPIVLATALEQGISMNTRMDGSYKRTINGTEFRNAVTSEDGIYSIKDMTRMSINTAYIELGQRVGLKNVVEMAKTMGMPESTENLDPTYTSLPLGVIDTSSVTMASIYSTFASGGVHRDAHVIESIERTDNQPVRNKDGEVIEKLRWEKPKRAFSEEVAADATAAMRSVVTGGTGKGAALPNRPVAGKTGTTDKNRSAWFVGFTPQLATSVAMWRQEDGDRLSLRGIGGYNEVSGGSVPADLFKTFMMKAHQGQPVEQFPPAANVGEIAPWAKVEERETETSTPTPTNTPTCEPGENGRNPGGRNRPDNCPSETPTPTETPTTTAPPEEEEKPCTSPFNTPVGCNPDLPPPGHPNWWCDRENRRETVAQCREEEEEGPNRPGGPQQQN